MQWLFFESSQIAPCFGPVWFNTFGMPKLGHEPKSNKEIQDSIDSAEWALEKLEGHLSTNQFVLGDDFTLVDASIGAQLAALHQTLLRKGDNWLIVFRYKEAFINRESWSKAKGSSIWD